MLLRDELDIADVVMEQRSARCLRRVTLRTKKPSRAKVLCSSLAPLAADTRPECVSLKPSLSSGRLHLLSLVCRARTLQDCSDRVLAEPDMARDRCHTGHRAVPMGTQQHRPRA